MCRRSSLTRRRRCSSRACASAARRWRRVGQGLSNADIARQLFMSEATVKTHVSRLLLKLDCTNRVQVAIVAHHAGLLDG